MSKNICWIRLYEKIDQASFSLSLLGKGLNYAIIKEKQCSQVTNLGFLLKAPSLAWSLLMNVTPSPCIPSFSQLNFWVHSFGSFG